MEPNIEEIVKRVQKGEFEQFAQLFEAFYKKIYSFVYYRTHHKETAEDITSLVFTKAMEHIQSYNSHKASFPTWLYRIAKNTIIDHYRTRTENSNIEDAWDIASPSSQETDLDTQQQLKKVKDYLQGLTSVQRDLVIMRVWDGLSHKEIAEVLGINEATSKMTFSRVMAKINKDFVLVSLLILQSIWTK